MATKNQEDFLNLLNPVYHRLERFTLTLINNREIAKDILSETITIAYQQFSSLRNRDLFLSYLFRIASRVARKHYKYRTMHVSFDSLENELIQSAIQIENSVESRLLYEAMENLKFEYKEAITLVDILGYSNKEAAAIMGVSLANIKIRIFRGRKMLLAALDPNSNIKSVSVRLT